MRSQRPLHLDRRGYAGARHREHREERITLGVDLPAVMCGELCADKPMMIAEKLGVRRPQAPQHRRRTLDVSE